MGIKDIASRLIAKHGREVEILRQGPGQSDGAGNYTDGPIEVFFGQAVSASNIVLAELIGGFLSGVREDRLLLSCEGLTIVPTTDDELRMDDAVMRINRVSPLAPDGDTLFYELEITDV